MSKPAIGIALIFLINSIACPYAVSGDLFLPAPGVMVRLSPSFDPPILKGIKVHTDDPFRFDFILDKGDESDRYPEQLKTEATKLIKYFLASLTIPEKDLWVNLSPYEKDRIVPQSFGLTEMGRDLLAEDYMLKQITASLIYPEDVIGKKFWKRIYEEAAKKFGTTSIPVNTFNKVWIVPEKAVVYENAKAGTAYVVESKLKVMLEQDYLSMSKHTDVGETRGQDPNINRMGSQIVREIVIPELNREVNEDQNFSQLRQVYNSLILATWYKKKIKDSILARVYEDKKKVAGVGYASSTNDVEAIYQRYLQAFKKGVYNYIKEDIDPATQETIPRKYFSGGVTCVAVGAKLEEITSDVPNFAMIGKSRGVRIDVGLLGSMRAVLNKIVKDPLKGKRVTFYSEITDPVGLMAGHLFVDGKEFLREGFSNFLFEYDGVSILVLAGIAPDKDALERRFNELYKLGITPQCLFSDRTRDQHPYIVVDGIQYRQGRFNKTQIKSVNTLLGRLVRNNLYVKDFSPSDLMLDKAGDVLLGNLDNLSQKSNVSRKGMVDLYLKAYEQGGWNEIDTEGRDIYKFILSLENDGATVDSAQLGGSIIDEMINTLGENKEASGIQGSIVLLRDVYAMGLLTEILEVTSVKGFPEWHISAGGDMVVNQRAVEHLLRWLRAYKTKHAAFDRLPASANPADAAPKPEPEPANPVTGPVQAEPVPVQAGSARPDTANPMTVGDAREIIKQAQLKTSKWSKLVRIAILLGKKEGTVPQIGQALDLLHQASKITAIPNFEDDINMGVVEIAALRGLYSNNGQGHIGEEELIQAKKFITTASGITLSDSSNSIAVARIAVLLGIKKGTDAKKQVKRAYNLIIKASAVTNILDIWNDINLGIVEIAALDGISSADGQEELLRAYRLVSITVASRTKSNLLNNVAFVKSAALLGSAEDLQEDVFELTAQAYGNDRFYQLRDDKKLAVALAVVQTVALSQWKVQDAAMLSGGSINIHLIPRTASDGLLQDPLAGKTVTLQGPNEGVPRHLAIVTSGTATGSESVNPLLETSLYSIFGYKNRMIVVIRNMVIDSNSIEDAFKASKEALGNKFGSMAVFLTRGRLKGEHPYYYLVLEVPKDHAMAADIQQNNTREELEEFGFSFDGNRVSWDPVRNQHSDWTPQTRWSPQEGDLDVKSVEGLSSIAIDGMVHFVETSNSKLFLAMADINGHRQPIVVKQYTNAGGKSGYYAMAYVPGESKVLFTVSEDERKKIMSLELIGKRKEITRYFAYRRLHPPEEFIYTPDGNVMPIDADTVNSENGPEFLNEAVRADVLSQLGGPKFYGLVTLKSSADQARDSSIQDKDQKSEHVDTGGIDLTHANGNIQVQAPTGALGNDNGGIEFRLDPATLAEWQNTPGFVPVIISIQPMTDLKEFLLQ